MMNSQFASFIVSAMLMNDYLIQFVSVANYSVTISQKWLLIKVVTLILSCHFNFDCFIQKKITFLLIFFSFSGCDGQPDDDESAKSLNSNCDNQASSSMMEETTNEHDLQVSKFFLISLIEMTLQCPKSKQVMDCLSLRYCICNKNLPLTNPLCSRNFQNVKLRLDFVEI